MLLLITSAYTPLVSAVPEFKAHLDLDRFNIHSLTDDPEKADIILFVDVRADLGDWPMKKIRNHEFVKRFPEKCFVFCEMDQPWCGMPGLYTSMPKSSFIRQRQRSFSYHTLAVGENLAKTVWKKGEPALLFSFMGRSLPGAREAVLKIRHPRGLIEDTSKFNFFSGDISHLSGQESKYQEVILDSKFVLCPAGAGTASIRQFEAMAARRVPVIISDEWVETDNLDWSTCSVRIAENDIASLPSVLEKKEADWAEMATAARNAYDEWFAPDVVFHRIMEACLDIQINRRIPEKWLSRLPSRRYIRLWLRHLKSVLLQRATSPIKTA